MSVEGFRDHVATEGSLLGVWGRWSACGLSFVHVDHDGEMLPLHEMIGNFGC